MVLTQNLCYTNFLHTSQSLQWAATVNHARVPSPLTQQTNPLYIPLGGFKKPLNACLLRICMCNLYNVSCRFKCTSGYQREFGRFAQSFEIFLIAAAQFLLNFSYVFVE